jgi:phosphatidate cytidylyltransferase
MVAEKEGNEDRSDDLFDDLDRYFSPIEEQEWPDIETPTPSADRPASRPAEIPPDIVVEEPTSGWEPAEMLARGSGSEEGGVRPPADRGTDRETQSAEPGSSEPEPDADGSGDLAAAGGPPAPAAPTPRPTPAGPPSFDAPTAPVQSEPLPTPGDTPSPEPDETPSPAAPSDADLWSESSPGELSRDEWSRLRDVLGDEEDEEEYGFDVSPAQPAQGPALFGFEEEEAGSEPTEREGGERGPELSLEDLKKAPPQYRDLPAADAGEGAVESDAVIGESAERFAPSEAGPPTGPRQGGSLADVEAAADQLANEFGPPGEVDDDLLTDVEEPREAPPPRRIRVGEPEAMMGPTWQEPSSQALMDEAETPRPSTGRNMPAAVISAVLLAVAALIALAIEEWAFAIVAGLVITLAQAELYATMKRRGHQPATALGLVAGVLLLAAAYFRGEQAMLFFVVLAIAMSFLWYMAAPPTARTALLGNVGSTVLGLFIPLLGAYALLISTQDNSGRVLVLAVLGLTFWYDVAAFAIGTLWGSRPLAPAISPKKSWEGLIGATFATIFAGIAFLPFIDIMSLGRSIGLALVVVVFAPIGDLIESAMKRDLGVKDMGSIMPGHGGMLDRVDSALLVAPAAFYFLRLVF